MDRENERTFSLIGKQYACYTRTDDPVIRIERPGGASPESVEFYGGGNHASVGGRTWRRVGMEWRPVTANLKHGEPYPDPETAQHFADLDAIRAAEFYQRTIRGEERGRRESEQPVKHPEWWQVYGKRRGGVYR